jgi:hypothetical protein
MPVPIVHVILPPNLTAQDLRVVLKYFEQTDRLTPQEWKTALKAFDELGKGKVAIGRRRMSFRRVYERMVDDEYTDAFIEHLLATEIAEREADEYQQNAALELLAMLEGEGLYRKEVVGSEYLAA